MKKSMTVLAIAGLASASGAQTGTLSLVASASTVFTTGIAATITLAVYGDADFGTAISGGAFGLSATGGEGYIAGTTASATAWGALGFMDLGDAGDGNHNGMVFGQFIFPPALPPAADSLLGNGPILLGTFQVTLVADTYEQIDWTTTGGIGDFTMEIYDDATGMYTQMTTSVSHGSASIMVVPSPSGLAVLGLGGLVAGRRRR